MIRAEELKTIYSPHGGKTLATEEKIGKDE